MTQVPNSQDDTTLPTTRLLSEIPQLLLSTSTVPGLSGMSRLDLAIARMVVKKQVRAGFRKGPSDYLVLPDSEIEHWLDEEAVRYLEENLKGRQASGANG